MYVCLVTAARKFWQDDHAPPSSCLPPPFPRPLTLLLLFVRYMAGSDPSTLSAELRYRLAHGFAPHLLGHLVPVQLLPLAVDDLRRNRSLAVRSGCTGTVETEELHDGANLECGYERPGVFRAGQTEVALRKERSQHMHELVNVEARTEVMPLL